MQSDMVPKPHSLRKGLRTMKSVKAGLYVSVGVCLMGLFGMTPTKAVGWVAGAYTVVSEDDVIPDDVGGSLYWATDTPSVSAWFESGTGQITLDVVYKRHFSYSGGLPAPSLTIVPTGNVYGNTVFASSRVTAEKDLFDSTDL